MGQTWKSNLMLIIATTIWGLTFLVQKNVADVISPFYFTALRFTLGAIVLLPVAIYISPLPKNIYKVPFKLFIYFLPTFILGPVLLIAAAVQQWGLEYTSEQNSSFITTLYVIITPLIAYAMGGKISKYHWVASIFMIVGVYFLSFENRNPFAEGSLNFGDLLTFICAFFWAIHIMLLAILTQKLPPLWIAFGQNISCAFFGFLVAFMIEEPTIGILKGIHWEVLFAGVISVGIAYTLQVMGQRHAPPAAAVIILSMEAIIATVAAMIYRGESISDWAILGGSLMFLALLVAELLPILVAQHRNKKQIY